MPDHELNRILRELDCARDAHREALAQANAAIKLCADLGSANPDGAQAMSRAQAELRPAFERYRRALKVFDEYCQKTVRRGAMDAQ